MANETASTSALRQAETVISVEGIVAENTLTEEPAPKSKDGKDGKGTVIKGEIAVRVDDVTVIPIQVFCKSITNAGTESKLYKGAKTIMDTYKSIAQVGMDEATRVRVSSGSLNLSRFLSKAGDVIDGLKFQSNFFTSNPKDFEPKAEFKIEGVIEAFRPEMVKNPDSNVMEASGRLFVDIIVPDYEGRVRKMHLIASEELADAVQSALSVGEQRMFYGNIINARIEHVKEIPMAIGAPKKEITYTFIQEFNLTNVSDESFIKQPYDEALINAGKAEYEAETQTLIAHAQNGGNKSRANATGEFKTSASSTPKRAGLGF